MISVKRIDVKDTYPLRQEVLRKNIDLPYQFEGDLNNTTFHLGVFLHEKIVCIGTFMKNSIPELKGTQYQLRGMASATDARRKGFGKLLLNVATNELRQREIDFLWCNARSSAVLFYENNEFQQIGDRFTNAVGPHYKMFKTLKYE